jgi:PIN domain nuclease of toxin-antitoxin system
VIVLDTHALVWWVTGDAKLSRRAKAAIQRKQATGEIVVSCISAWEIAMLVQRGRLQLSMDVSSWFAMVAELDGVHFLPVDVEIATKSVELPATFHKDPADRMIVATARKLAVPLVTKDEKIRSYELVKSIW